MVRTLLPDAFRGPGLVPTARRATLVGLLVASTFVVGTPDILASLIYGFATLWVVLVVCGAVFRHYAP